MDSLQSPHDKRIKVTLYEVQRTTFVSGASAALGLLSQGRVGWRLWGYCTAVVLGLKQAAALKVANSGGISVKPSDS